MSTYSKEVFRKTLHVAVLFFTIFWFYMYEDWKKSVFTIAVVLIIVYPILLLLSKVPGMTKLVNARKTGEFANSFAALMIMFIVVASICWGWLGDRAIGIASIFAWGPGDAAAALIGKKFGSIKIGRKHKKSLQGSIAMFVFSFASVIAVYMVFGKYNVGFTVLAALMTAAISATVELLVENGFDTFYCPVSAMGVLVLFEMIWRL